MSDGEHLTWRREGAAAVIAGARPAVLNAATVATHRALVAALDRADADDGVRGVILTGEGRAFCAGTDISDGFALPSGGDVETGAGVPPDVGGATVLRLFAMRKPVIAAVNGIAAGFGASLTAACDIRLAAETARFAFLFARRGICAESCVSWFLPRVVGLPTALDWMMTGRTVSAEEALQVRFVRSLHAPDALLPAALALVDEIAQETAPASVAINRQLLWRMSGAADPAVAHDYESRGVAARLAHPDSAEGVAAFVERRKPRFAPGLDGAAMMNRWWS